MLLCGEAAERGDHQGAELWFRRAWAQEPDAASAARLWDAVGRCAPYATAQRLLAVSGPSPAAATALLRAAATSCDLDSAETWATNATVDQRLDLQ